MTKFANLCLAGLLLLIAPAAQAQDAAVPPLSQQNGALVFDRLGYRVTMPLPDWSQSPAEPIASQVEIHYFAEAGQALVEMRPKGETEALWTTLYGARVLLGPDQPLTAYRAAVMAGYTATCDPQQTGFFQLTPDTADTLAPLGFVCGGYRAGLAGRDGLGEVAVMSFKKSAGGVAIVFQEWRGKGFDPTVPTSWPVATDVVQARLAQLQDQASFTAAD